MDDDYKPNWPAVRAFGRLADRALDASAEAAALDAGFDAGEWSGPAHDQMLDDELERLSKLVADRFGLLPNEVFWPWSYWGDWTLSLQMNHLRGAP